jgi:hypothetical protein
LKFSSVVITGRFSKNRNEIIKHIENAGMIVRPGITDNTSYLVFGETYQGTDTKKIEDARKRRVPMIDEEMLYEMLDKRNSSASKKKNNTLLSSSPVRPKGSPRVKKYLPPASNSATTKSSTSVRLEAPLPRKKSSVQYSQPQEIVNNRLLPPAPKVSKKQPAVKSHPSASRKSSNVGQLHVHKPKESEDEEEEDDEDYSAGDETDISETISEGDVEFSSLPKLKKSALVKEEEDTELEEKELVVLVPGRHRGEFTAIHVQHTISPDALKRIVGDTDAHIVRSKFKWVDSFVSNNVLPLINEKDVELNFLLS